MSLLTVLFLFFIYCIIGWVWESIYESIRNKKLLNRGFLNGPYIPIYGFGGLGILFFLQGFQSDVFFSLTTLKVYLVSAVGASVLEYVTSYVLEKILKARWWDYSDYPLNLNGRICLIASLFWGVAAVGAINFINPALIKLFRQLSHDAVLVFVSVMCTLFVLDLAVTINSILDLKNRIGLLMALEKDKVSEVFSDRLEDLAKYKEKIRNIGNPFTRRIIESFPKLKFSSEAIQKVFDKVRNFSRPSRRKDNEEK